MNVKEFYAQYVKYVVERNRKHSNIHRGDHPLAIFDCVDEPSVPIDKFILKITKSVFDSELACAIILAERLLARSGVPLGVYNCHRLMLTAIMVSVKMQRDIQGVITYMHVATGLAKNILAISETRFLCLLDWEIHVGGEEFEQYVSMVNDSLPVADGDGPVSLCPKQKKLRSPVGPHRVLADVKKVRESSLRGSPSSPTPPSGRNGSSSFRSGSWRMRAI
eukprot:Hpha_TRINITY_DN14234_c0_g2::TRINITY_DN14234_c0_g2_i1::g.22644::m.22644